MTYALPDDLTDADRAEVARLLRDIWGEDIAGANKWLGQYCGPLWGKPLEILRRDETRDTARVVTELREVSAVITVHHGDCLDVMRGMADASVDSVVTDPPYGLKFMGRAWDHGVPGVPFWSEMLRVLKPGGHLVSFGGTRTYHRMACAIEDTGFEIRDQLSWIYGSGFPKSQNVGKAFEKAGGAEREVVGPATHLHAGRIFRPEGGWNGNALVPCDKHMLTAPATDLAKQWDGWGTALKPAHEPICLARKPLIGTVAANVAAHGTGAINVDKCRISLSSQQLDGDVCAQLFELYFSGDRQPDSTSELRGYVRRIELALHACNTDDTPHGHSAPGLDGTSPADVRAVQSLLSRLLASGAECVLTNLQSLGSQADCRSCRRLYDECAHLIGVADPSDLPSLAGALAGISQELSSPPRSHGCQCSARLSSSDALMLRATFFARLIADVKQQDATYLAPRQESTKRHRNGSESPSGWERGYQKAYVTGSDAGRWPANVCHDGSDEVLEAFARFGDRASTPFRQNDPGVSLLEGGITLRAAGGFFDTGTAARFFKSCPFTDDELRFHYSGKATKAERAGSKHPTVKPLALMQWLVRLVTPPGGTVLDPFAGSGTTGVAASREGFNAILIEREAEYVADTNRRIASDAPLLASCA